MKERSKNGLKSLRDARKSRERAIAVGWIEGLEPRLMFNVASAQIDPGFTISEMRADPVRDAVYILDATNNRVIELNTEVGRPAAIATVAGTPTSLAISIDHSLLYVTSSSANKIQVFSLPNLTLVRTLTVWSPGEITAGAGGRLYVSDGQPWDAVREVNGQTGAVIASIGSYYNPFMRTNAAGTILYVSELHLSTTGTDAYDISSGTGTPPLTGSYATNMANGSDLEVDDQNDRLYAMSGGVYGVYSYNLDTNSGQTLSFGGAAYGTSVSVNSAVPYFAAGSDDPYSGGVFLYSRDSGTVVGHYTTLAGDTDVLDVQLTANGHVVYTGSDPSLYGGTGHIQLGIIGVSSLSLSGALAPLADAGGPYAGVEGQKITVSAPKLGGLQGLLAKYEWDFNYDPTQGFITDATGRTASMLLRDGPATVTIAVRMTTSGVSSVSTTTVTIANQPPTLRISGAWTVADGSTYTLALSASDPGQDTISSWVINWGDGTPVQTVTGHPNTVRHVFVSGPSSYTIRAQATDEDGIYQAADKTVQVSRIWQWHIGW